MKVYTYRGVNGGLQMITEDNCFDMIRLLGRSFADALAMRGKSKPEDTSQLMDGLAAYTMLELEGEDPRLDCAYKVVMKLAADATFERLRASYV
jgi:hypothetical protein